MIRIIKSIICGIIEGITEWLPISSTGHLIILDKWLAFADDDFMEMYYVLIQLGAVLAVVFCFSNKLFGKFEEKKVLWSKIAIGVIPITIVGFFLDDWITDRFYNPFTIALALIFYGIVFLIIKYSGPKNDSISYRDALFIGLFQVLALIPGTSRSGITIIGALLIGKSQKAASEFTFFLAIPIMFGASFLKITKYGVAFSSDQWCLLLVGMIMAFLVSLIVIRFLLAYFRNRNFRIFGIYRIILGIIILYIFL